MARICRVRDSVCVPTNRILLESERAYEQQTIGPHSDGALHGHRARPAAARDPGDGPRGGRPSGMPAQPWLVGSNYIPANAINQLEMWQAETFDPKRIDTELGWAEGLGMTTMRVFLHDLVWQQDAAGYRQRIDTFLAIAAKHHIRPLLVLFDSCWDPFPQLGRQRDPKPGVHNSGWMQSPGARALENPAEHPASKPTYEASSGRSARTSASSAGTSGTSRTTRTTAATEPRNRAEKWSSCSRCCPRRSSGHGRRRHSSPSRRVCGGEIGRADDKLSPMERIQLEHVGRDLLPQLRQRSGVREAHQVAAALSTPDPLHGIHGARQREHLPGLTPSREEIQSGCDQLGLRGGKDADLPAMGFMADARMWIASRPSGSTRSSERDGTPYRQDEVDLIKTLTSSPALPAAVGAP